MKNFTYLFIVIFFIVSCEKKPGPLTPSEYSLLSEYLSGSYYGFYSEKEDDLAQAVINNSVGESEILRTEIFIENDSLVHETTRRFKNFAATGIFDNTDQIYKYGGKIKFTKQFNNNIDPPTPEIKVYLEDSPYFLQTIESEKFRHSSFDTLFAEIKSKIEEENKILKGYEIAKQNFYTADKLNDIRLETKKNTARRILPESIRVKPEFLKSFESDYKNDIAVQFLKKFTDNTGRVLKEKNGINTNDAFNSFWVDYLTNDLTNISKADQLEFVDTNSLFFYNKVNNLDNLEIKLDYEEIDFENDIMFNAGYRRYQQKNYPAFGEFPLTDESERSLKLFFGLDQTDVIKATVYSDGRFIIEANDSFSDLIFSWNLHWDKKTQLVRLYDEGKSEYLIFKKIG